MNQMKKNKKSINSIFGEMAKVYTKLIWKRNSKEST